MNIQHIITNALIEYDTAQPTIRYLKRYAKIEGERTGIDTERTKFKFIDKNTKKIIIDTEVEILGVFYGKYNVWTWAWSHIGLTNSENFLSKEILLYALKLGSDMSYLKSLLTTSRGVVKDRTQVDINLAIGSSIIKQPYIYPFEYTVGDHKLIYYFILLNRTDLQKISKEINDTIQIDNDLD